LIGWVPIVWILALIWRKPNRREVMTWVCLLAMVVGVKTATPVVAFAASTIALLILLKSWRDVDVRGHGGRPAIGTLACLHPSPPLLSRQRPRHVLPRPERRAELFG